MNLYLRNAKSQVSTNTRVWYNMFLKQSEKLNLNLVYVKVWKWDGSKCYWIQKQIELFHFHLSMSSASMGELPSFKTNFNFIFCCLISDGSTCRLKFNWYLIQVFFLRIMKRFFQRLSSYPWLSPVFVGSHVMFSDKGCILLSYLHKILTYSHR